MTCRHKHSVCSAWMMQLHRADMYLHTKIVLVSFFWLSDRRAGYLKSRNQHTYIIVIFIYIHTYILYFNGPRLLFFVLYVFESWRVRMHKKHAYKRQKKKTALRSTLMFIILCISLRPCSRQTMVCWSFFFVWCGCMIVAEFALCDQCYCKTCRG